MKNVVFCHILRKRQKLIQEKYSKKYTTLLIKKKYVIIRKNNKRTIFQTQKGVHTLWKSKKYGQCISARLVVPKKLLPQ